MCCDLQGCRKVEQRRTNIGRIRVKMSGTNFPAVAEMFKCRVRMDAYMDVGSTTPGKEEVESSRDAYTDVGSRVMHD